MAKWSQKEKDYLVAHYNTASEEELCQRLGNRSIDAIRRAASRFGVAGERELRTLTTDELGIQERLKADRQLSRSAAEAKYYKRLYTQAIKSLNMQDMLAETMRDVAQVVPPITVQSISLPGQPITRDDGSETDVLQVSDLHGGEVVEADEVIGLPHYDMQVLGQRLGTLFWRALDLINRRRASSFIPQLIIAEQGDMLSGEIHEELVRTNIAHMMTVAVRVAFMVSQGIAYLSPHFDDIKVRCVVGNHPRLRKQKYYKQRYINWDYMCYQWQAILCRGLNNVRFSIPRGPYDIVNAERTRLLLYHGDDIRTWMKMPWYGIQAAANRLRKLLQVKGDYYDVLMLGHFHNRADVDDGVGPLLVNGSVKGGDEFSTGSLQTTNKPSQNLLWFHDEHGYIGGQPIYLQPHPKAPEFEDILPEVWGDLVDKIG